MKQLLLIVLISTVALSCHAQADSPDDIANTFFNKYEKDKMEALNYLFSSNKWMDKSKDQIDNLKNQLIGTTELLGEYYGYELLARKKINQLELHTYFIKYDRQPLRFTILFYKPNDQWRLQNFSFDDNLDGEMEDAVRIHKLDLN